MIAVKSLIENLLVRSGAVFLARRVNSGRGVVLAYHNIVPRGEDPSGERNLHLDQREFARQLDLLLETCDPVSLSELVRPTSATDGRLRVAITFDDAYAGSLTAGVEELVARDVSATFFVAPMLLDGEVFWWDTLSDPSTGRLDEEVRRHALHRLAGRQSDVYRWAEQEGIRRHTPPGYARSGTIAQLVAAVGQPGIDVGSHSWSHPNLTRLSGDDLEEELAHPLSWLRKRDLDPVPWLAYPYGLFSATVRHAAERHYSGAVALEGSVVPSSESEPGRFAVARRSVPSGISRAGFAILSSGLRIPRPRMLRALDLSSHPGR